MPKKARSQPRPAATAVLLRLWVAAVLALAFGKVAVADVRVYGRVVAGLNAVQTGNTHNLDLGATGFDGDGGLSSRLGFEGAAQVTGKLVAGFQIERELQAQGSPGRYQNIWFKTEFGKVTVGQQPNPYYTARHWDQTQFFGGQKDYGELGPRTEGINLYLESNGFEFDLMAVGSDADGAPVPAQCRPINAPTTAVMDCAEPRPADQEMVAEAIPAVRANARVDGWIVRVGWDLGYAYLNAARHADYTGSTTARKNTALGFSGNIGRVGWYLAHQHSTLARTEQQDVISTGLFLDYQPTETRSWYLYRVHHREFGGQNSGELLSAAPRETVLGFAQHLGGNTSFHIEYLDFDPGSGAANKTEKMFIGLKVAF